MREIPVPAFASALSWYDGCRRERAPANLVGDFATTSAPHTYPAERGGGASTPGGDGMAAKYVPTRDQRPTLGS